VTLLEALTTQLTREGSHSIRLDLSDVNTADQLELRMIRDLATRLHSNGVELLVVNGLSSHLAEPGQSGVSSDRSSAKLHRA
jgi:anti-anti-sigma regulatory factor